ncbi:MAG: thioredoxin-disulfide reductase [Candidatus Gastranaerophilales bacterium]|nr:thioredoxin-disulfide reductase [Candidatus Gastranaerophilales bacterium]
MEKVKEEFNFDLLILGGGPAGLSAGIYGARGELSTAIVDISMLGGQPTNYLEIENYPSYAMSGGYELMEKFEEHADKFNVKKFPMEEVLSVKLKGDDKIIETESKIFKSKAIILCTGAKARKLGIPGEKEFAGRGVSYCAVCDGAFFKNKVICVVGGGNSAIEEALYLTKFASKVYIIHRRDELRADKIIQQRAFKNPQIEFVYNSVPLEIVGDNMVTSIIIKDVKTDKVSEIKTNGVFPYIGFAANAELYTDEIEKDKNGFIITNEKMETSIKGVYAAGDLRNTPLRQVITAASDGAIAATYAIKYIEEIK